MPEAHTFRRQFYQPHTHSPKNHQFLHLRAPWQQEKPHRAGSACPAGQGRAAAHSLGTLRAPRRAAQPPLSPPASQAPNWDCPSSRGKAPLRAFRSCCVLPCTHQPLKPWLRALLSSQKPGPDCTQDIIIKGFVQPLTLSSKSNYKIKIKYCFYRKSPTQTFCATLRS